MTKIMNEGEATGRSQPKWGRRILKRFANLSLLVLTLASMSYLYWVYVDDRFLTVVENNVFRAAEMQPDELLEFVERHHVKTVIDFRTIPDRVDANSGRWYQTRDEW